MAASSATVHKSAWANHSSTRKRKARSNKEIKKLNLKRWQLWTSSECMQDTHQKGIGSNPKEDVESSEIWGSSQQSRAKGDDAAPHPYVQVFM